MQKHLHLISGLFFCFCVDAVINSVITPREEREKRNVVDDLIDPQMIKNMLARATQADGVVDPHLLFRNEIEDPLTIPDLNISTSETFSEIDGQFWNMKLHGLRQLQIRRVDINVVQMNITVEMIVSILRMNGSYNLDGTVHVFPVTGEGNFLMNVTDTVATGSASFQKSPNEPLEVDEVYFNIEDGGTELHFENLMGGDAWEAVSNTLLNQMSERIFSQSKTSMLDELKVAIKNEMNARLMNISSGFFATSNSSTIFDDLIQQAGAELQTSGKDPMHLPDFKESFFKKALALINAHGRLRLVNGTLYGLSSLHRTGDIVLTYENNSVTLEASLGFRNITGSYGWHFHAMGIGPKGKVTISIKELSVYISIRQELRTGSRPQILDLRVERIGYIWLDVDGLGPLDVFLEIYINMITNTLKDIISNTTVIPVRIAIQRELDNLPVFLS